MLAIQNATIVDEWGMKHNIVVLVGFVAWLPSACVPDAGEVEADIRERVGSFGLSVVPGTSHGKPGSASADQSFELDDLSGLCEVYEWVRPSGTTYWNQIEDTIIVLLWDPAAIGTFQTLEARCLCEDYYGNLSEEVVTKTYEIVP